MSRTDCGGLRCVHGALYPAKSLLTKADGLPCVCMRDVQMRSLIQHHLIHLMRLWCHGAHADSLVALAAQTLSAAHSLVVHHEGHGLIIAASRLRHHLHLRALLLLLLLKLVRLDILVTVLL